MSSNRVRYTYPYSLFAVGMVAAGDGGNRSSKFGTTSALLSMSRQTPSIAPTTVAVAKACVESNFGRPRHRLAGDALAPDLDGKASPQYKEIQSRLLRLALARSQAVPNVLPVRLLSAASGL